MAISLTKVLNNGFSATYARITRLSIDFVARQSILDISYYKDEASFSATLDPIKVETKEFNGDEFIFSSDLLLAHSPVELAYEALVLLPDFVGSSKIPDVPVPVKQNPLEPINPSAHKP